MSIFRKVFREIIPKTKKLHDKEIRLRGAYIQGYLTTYFKESDPLANSEEKKSNQPANLEKKKSNLLANLEGKKSDKIIVMKPGLDLKNSKRPERPLIPVFGQWCDHDKDNKYASGFIIGNEERNAQGNDQCVKIPLLELVKTNKTCEGTHGKLHVFSCSTDRKIIVKTLEKKDNEEKDREFECIKEITSMINFQETDVSPKIHFTLEKNGSYDVYMEMIFPGKTLEDIIPEISKTGLDIGVKFLHFVVYLLIQRLDEIWHKGWIHGDVMLLNVMIEESNGCVNLRIIDFGNAEEIETVTNETVERDIIKLFNLIQMILVELNHSNSRLVEKSGLGEYRTTLEACPNLDAIEKLKKEVMTLAIDFGTDRAANEEIIKLISAK